MGPHSRGVAGRPDEGIVPVAGAGLRMPGSAMSCDDTEQEPWKSSLHRKFFKARS